MATGQGGWQGGPLAVVLAGGQSRRMGGTDKALRPLGGEGLLSRVIERLDPQVEAIALSGADTGGRLSAFGRPVLPDAGDDRAGPLAGVLAALRWAEARGAPAVLTVPCDTPFLPGDLVPRLLLAAEPTGAALAESGGQAHPTVALWPVPALPRVAAALAAGDHRLLPVLLSLDPGRAEWPAVPRDPFLNLNTPEDWAMAEAWLTA